MCVFFGWSPLEKLTKYWNCKSISNRLFKAKYGEKTHKKTPPTASPSPIFFFLDLLQYLSRHGEHCSNYCSISKQYPRLKYYPVEWKNNSLSHSFSLSFFTLSCFSISMVTYHNQNKNTKPNRKIWNTKTIFLISLMKSKQ